MTRRKFEANEQREYLFRKSGYRCAACGGSILRYSTPQLAHRIAKTKANISKYGAEVIHHPLNLAPVCCLRCNDSMNIGNKPADCAELVEKIERSINAEKG